LNSRATVVAETARLLDTSILVDRLRGSASARRWIDALNLKHFAAFPGVQAEMPY